MVEEKQRKLKKVFTIIFSSSNSEHNLNRPMKMIIPKGIRSKEKSYNFWSSRKRRLIIIT